jgi:hypothetical protein
MFIFFDESIHYPSYIKGSNLLEGITSTRLIEKIKRIKELEILAHFTLSNFILFYYIS